jgi:phosphoenolpyruvate carboxykinase (ATP)
VDAILEGKLENVEVEADPVFGLQIPVTVEGVPSELLVPRNTWSDKDAYDKAAKDLAGGFRKNFARFDKVSKEIKQAEPKG